MSLFAGDRATSLRADEDELVETTSPRFVQPLRRTGAYSAELRFAH